MISQHELLEAECLASLFGSESAFNQALPDLAPGNTKLQTLWREVEGPLLKIVPGMSLHRLQHLRDHMWFPAGASNKNYTEVLASVGQNLLTDQGSTALPRFDPHSKDRDDIQRWRWYVFSLPPDLLLAATFGPNGPQSIRLSHSLLEQNLKDKGFNEVHLHLGAALDFPMLWVSALNVLARDQYNPQALQSPGAVLNEGKNLAPWLLAGAIVRQLVFAFVSQPKQKEGFQAYLKRVYQDLQLKYEDLAQTLAIVLQSLARPDRCPRADFRKMQELYRHLIPKRSGRPKTLDELWQYDPIAGFSVQGVAPQYKELYLTRLALAYLDHSQDKIFATFFWQVVRLKTLLYRHIIQRPQVSGLQWFIRFYSRIGAIDGLLEDVFLESAFVLCGGQRGLKALEIRKSPKPDVVKNKHTLRSMLGAWQKMPQAQSTELGLILHLSKDSGSKAQNGHLIVAAEDSNANPAYLRNAAHVRYSHYFSQKKAEVYALQQLLNLAPKTLYFIRGIDICTDELAIPNWVMAMLIQQLQRLGKNTEKILRVTQPHWPIQPLRTTIHVGEDFYHLMDGLRHMYEVIEFFPLACGDRIGHGLALGLEPNHWSEKQALVWLPKEVRLWNLVWERSLYGKGELQATAGRIEQIAQEIQSLGTEIFGTISPAELQELYYNLFSARKLALAGFPDGEGLSADAIQVNRSLQILKYYLTDTGCFRRGQVSTEVRKTPQEVQALHVVQAYVRQKAIEKEITIEVNPSSNFLIANLQELKHHPIWYLKPPQGAAIETSGQPPVRIAIGSDDPITFATALPQEYRLLQNVLHQMQINGQEAQNWLDQVRENGLNARFTLPVQPEGAKAGAIWNEILSELSQLD